MVLERLMAMIDRHDHMMDQLNHFLILVYNNCIQNKKNKKQTTILFLKALITPYLARKTTTYMYMT